MNMSLDPSVLPKLANATNLKLNNVKLPENFVEWLSSNGALRHLELRQSSAIRTWKTCAPNLEWLDISETGLEFLEVGEKCKLRWLYATDNRIKLLKLNTKPLKIIYLDRNQLERWPFENESNSRQFPNLEELSIKQNRIETLPARALYRFPLLENLDLSENLIERIEPDAFPTVGMALQYLNMSGNRLKEFGHPILPSLIILDISKNLLHGMDRQLLTGFPSLQHLHLSNNFNILNGCEHGDCWVEESGLENLIEIDLSGCQIKKQPNLANFVNLRAINLGGNLMGEVDGRRLPPCVAHLNLRWNRIHTMDNFTDIQMTCLKDLDLGHNPLKCDCSLLEFSEILALQPDLTDQNTYYCFTELLHPLNTYFEITSSCDVEESTSILLVLLNILTVLLTIAAVGCLILLFFVRVTRIVNFGSAQFFYRRVPTEIPTAL
uniref:LRRCT domain-containing protein n=1 Tax=Acrobeloides nanus TaxID=290746 RepID=A0A914CRA1_9BILA